MNTMIKPLSAEQARELAEMIRLGSDGRRGLALDEHGYVTKVIDVANADIERMLGDFDVHA